MRFADAASLDPVLRKELSGFSRRRQTYVARVLYVGTIGALLYSHWSELRVWDVSESANLGRRLFESFFWLQFGWVAATSVFGAADLVGREVRSGMLGLLALTPLDAEAITWGKWRAALAGSLSLVLCGVPVTAVCVYAGGVGPAELLWSTALTVTAAALGAAHGVLGAARSPTPVGSVARAAWGLARGLLLFGILYGITGPVPAAAFHPHFAALAASRSTPLDPFHAWLWVAAVPFTLWRSQRLLAQAHGHLALRGFGGPVDAPPDPRVGPMDPMIRFLYLGGFRSFEPPSWLLDAFPLVWKELVGRAATRAVRLWQVPAMFFAVPVVMVLGFYHREPAPAVAGVVLFLALLLALSTGAGLFAPEREGRRWDGLLAAPIGRARIVGAKLLSPLLTPEAAAIVAVVAVGVGGWGGLERLAAGFPAALASSLLFLAFAYASAAFASLHAPTPRAAFLASSGTVFALLALSTSSLGPGWLRALDPLAAIERPAAGLEFLGAYAGGVALLVAAMVLVLRRRAA